MVCVQFSVSDKKLKQIKGLQISEDGSVIYLIHGKLVTGDGLPSKMFNTLSDLNQILIDFDKLKVCKGCIDPDLMDKFTINNLSEVKRPSCWRSKHCRLFCQPSKRSSNSVCNSCSALIQSLNRKQSMIERESYRKQKVLTTKKKLQSYKEMLERKQARLEVKAFFPFNYFYSL